MRRFDVPEALDAFPEPGEYMLSGDEYLEIVYDNADGCRACVGHVLDVDPVPHPRFWKEVFYGPLVVEEDGSIFMLPGSYTDDIPPSGEGVD